VFEVSTVASLSGVYHGRVMASGLTLRSVAFSREQLLSAAVWNGGDDPDKPPRDDVKPDLCDLLSCLLNEKILTRELRARLEREGIDVDGLRQCLGELCRERRPERPAQ
jgi:hypothetical protein